MEKKTKRKDLGDLLDEAETSENPGHIVFSFDPKSERNMRKVMVYPWKWKEDPEKRKKITDPDPYFLFYIRRPKEMTFGKYRKRSMAEGMRSLNSYLRKKDKMEKKYSKGNDYFRFGASLP